MWPIPFSEELIPLCLLTIFQALLSLKTKGFSLVLNSCVVILAVAFCINISGQDWFYNTEEIEEDILA